MCKLIKGNAEFLHRNISIYAQLHKWLLDLLPYLNIGRGGKSAYDMDYYSFSCYYRLCKLSNLVSKRFIWLKGQEGTTIFYPSEVRYFTIIMQPYISQFSGLRLHCLPCGQWILSLNPSKHFLCKWKIWRSWEITFQDRMRPYQWRQERIRKGFP